MTQKGVVKMITETKTQIIAASVGIRVAANGFVVDLMSRKPGNFCDVTDRAEHVFTQLIDAKIFVFETLKQQFKGMETEALTPYEERCSAISSL
jgi:hypothetical protein